MFTEETGEETFEDLKLEMMEGTDTKRGRGVPNSFLMYN